MLNPGDIGNRRRRPPLWRARGGATAIETAILLPLLFAFLLGIEELGRLLWIQSVLQYSCEYAARYANLPQTTNIIHYAQEHVFGMSSQNIAFNYLSATTTPVSSCGGPEVTASYTFQSVVPINQLLGLAGVRALNGIILTAQSCLPPP